VDVSKATFELYPKIRTRELGSRLGRKSRIQSLPFDVHVVNACSSLFVGFNPWTATILGRISSKGLGMKGDSSVEEEHISYLSKYQIIVVRQGFRGCTSQKVNRDTLFYPGLARSIRVRAEGNNS
jgi:hypothetical protein